MSGRLPPKTRAAVEKAIQARDGRSRAQIARDTGVGTRTVQRIANALGINKPWDTTGTRKATEAAADRRAAARSEIANRLIDQHIPRLEARMAAADAWTKTVVLPGPDGATIAQAREDDAVIARGLKELHTAHGIAVDKTIAIDKHDRTDDGAASAVDQWLNAMLGRPGTP